MEKKTSVDCSWSSCDNSCLLRIALPFTVFCAHVRGIDFRLSKRSAFSQFSWKVRFPCLEATGLTYFLIDSPWFPVGPSLTADFLARCRLIGISPRSGCKSRSIFLISQRSDPCCCRFDDADNPRLSHSGLCRNLTACLNRDLTRTAIWCLSSQGASNFRGQLSIFVSCWGFLPPHLASRQVCHCRRPGLGGSGLLSYHHLH